MDFSFKVDAGYYFCYSSVNRLIITIIIILFGYYIIGYGNKEISFSMIRIIIIDFHLFDVRKYFSNFKIKRNITNIMRKTNPSIIDFETTLIVRNSSEISFYYGNLVVLQSNLHFSLDQKKTYN